MRAASEGEVGQHRDLGPENLLCTSGLQASLLPWVVSCPLILKSMGTPLKVCSLTDRLCGDGNEKRNGLSPDNSLRLHSMLFYGETKARRLPSVQTQLGYIVRPCLKYQSKIQIPVQLALLGIYSVNFSILLQPHQAL